MSRAWLKSMGIEQGLGWLERFLMSIGQTPQLACEKLCYSTRFRCRDPRKTSRIEERSCRRSGWRIAKSCASTETSVGARAERRGRRKTRKQKTGEGSRKSRNSRAGTSEG